MATDFTLSLILIAVVFILGLTSVRLPLLGALGAILGIVTLFDVASTGNFVMGYAYDLTLENPEIVQIVEKIVPLQMTAIIVIVWTVFFAVATSMQKLRD